MYRLSLSERFLSSTTVDLLDVFLCIVWRCLGHFELYTILIVFLCWCMHAYACGSVVDIEATSICKQKLAPGLNKVQLNAPHTW